MSAKYLIFGATGSIGSNLANKLHESNHDFHLVSRNEEELKSLSEKLKCTYTVTDVLEDNFIENVKTEISEVKGIAYCVGSIDLKPFKMVKEDDFQKCMKLNLYSAVEIIKAYQDSLKNNKGSIILFSTVAAQRGFANHSIIASTKAAIEGLAISLAAEFAPNIRVNCIAPTITRTDMAQRILRNEKIEENIANKHPLKKICEAKDISDMADFLISHNAKNITGQIMHVDGGMSTLKI